jgi:hypothetical protein
MSEQKKLTTIIPEIPKTKTIEEWEKKKKEYDRCQELASWGFKN